MIVIQYKYLNIIVLKYTNLSLIYSIFKVIPEIS